MFRQVLDRPYQIFDRWLLSSGGFVWVQTNTWQISKNVVNHLARENSQILDHKQVHVVASLAQQIHKQMSWSLERCPMVSNILQNILKLCSTIKLGNKEQLVSEQPNEPFLVTTLQVYFIYFIKVHIFWECHKFLRNLHCRFVLCSNGQIHGGDFAKFCGLLRIYELYWSLFTAMPCSA